VTELTVGAPVTGAAVGIVTQWAAWLRYGGGPRTPRRDVVGDTLGDPVGTHSSGRCGAPVGAQSSLFSCYSRADVGSLLVVGADVVGGRYSGRSVGAQLWEEYTWCRCDTRCSRSHLGGSSWSYGSLML
jgi:hypothetical protein